MNPSQLYQYLVDFTRKRYPQYKDVWIVEFIHAGLADNFSHEWARMALFGHTKLKNKKPNFPAWIIPPEYNPELPLKEQSKATLQYFVDRIKYFSL